MSLRHCKVEGESGYASSTRRVDTIKSAYNGQYVGLQRRHPPSSSAQTLPFLATISIAAVLRLDSKGLLDFDFPALVEKAVLTLAQRESGTDAARIYHFVVHETDDTSGSTKLCRWSVGALQLASEERGPLAHNLRPLL